MARVDIPVTQLDRVGVTPPTQVDSDATLKHSFSNVNGRVFLEIESTDAGDQTVDFELNTPLVDGVTVPPKTVTVPAGEIVLAGPWPKNYYNQAGQLVNVNPSIDATLHFRAYSI